MGQLRQNIKSVNFGLAYGITAISLSKQLGISKEEAESLIEDYFLTFENLKVFLDTSRADALKKGYVIFEDKLKAIFIQDNFHEIKEKEKKCKSYFFTDEYRNMNDEAREEYKRKLYINKPYIKEWFSDIGIMKSRLGNRGCNLRIQGLAAKQSKYAQILSRRHSIEHPELNWDILLLLHDEIVSESSSHPEEIFELQSSFMKQAAEHFCPNVIFTTSGGTSKIWEH